jgi:hypothetical protein
MAFSDRFSTLLVIASSTWFACAPSPELGQLRIRASHDMSCGDKENIHFKSVGDDVYDAEACGRHTEYVWVCDGHWPMSPCSWVRKHQPKSAAAAPSSSSPAR